MKLTTYQSFTNFIENYLDITIKDVVFEVKSNGNSIVDFEIIVQIPFEKNYLCFWALFDVDSISEIYYGGLGEGKELIEEVSLDRNMMEKIFINNIHKFKFDEI